MNDDKLPVHEWIMIVLFCGVLITLSGIAFYRQSSGRQIDVSLFEQTKSSVLHVSVSGAVLNPGRIELPLGSTVRDSLDKAGVLPEADLSRLRMNGKVKSGQRIVVPERVWITVILEGAIANPGPFKILSGTRCCELISLLNLPSEANIAGLKKLRRYLKEGEVIAIPFKKNKEARSDKTKRTRPVKNNLKTSKNTLK